jgi:hypothetical protein
MAGAPPATEYPTTTTLPACRTLFIVSVKDEINSLALLVADSMADMRAANSAACDSSKMRKIWPFTYRGKSSSKISSRFGS